MLTPKYENNVITQYWVKAHFSSIHCAHVTLTFDLCSPKLGHVTQRAWWIYVPIWKFRSFRLWNIRPQILDSVAPLLGNRRCHGNYSVPHFFGVVLMLAQTMKLLWPPIMELWHILPVYIIYPCDLDIWPIYTKIESRDQDPMLKILAYFEVYRPLCFWNIRS